MQGFSIYISVNCTITSTYFIAKKPLQVMMNNVYMKKKPATISQIFIFLLVASFLFSFNLSAQEKNPGGSGSYNLTAPVGTGNPYNYGTIGFGNGIYARPGATYPGPFQTHNWWNSAFWKVPYGTNSGNTLDMNSSDQMFPLPLMLEEYNQGLAFGYRTLEQMAEQPADFPGKNALVEGARYDLSMNCLANPTDNSPLSATTSVVDDYGDWHVKIAQQMGATKISTTMAKGNPFVFFDFNGPGTPVFNSGNGTQMKVIAVYNNSILVSLYWGTNSANPKVGSKPEGFYAFYFPAGTMIAGNDNVFKNISAIHVGDILSPIKVDLPAGATKFTMSIMPNGDASTLQLYEPHAYCVITGTVFSYSYDPVKAKVKNVFTTTTQAYDGHSNAPGTVNVLFRHQYIFPPASGMININTALDYYGPRGIMKILMGNSFSTEMYYNGSLPQLGKAQLKMDTVFVNTELNYIANHRFIADPAANHIFDHDDYASFKLAAQACRAAQIAHQLRNYAARDKLIAAAKVIIESFLTSPAGDRVCTSYSPAFNFMTTFPNSFGAYAGMYDYHFVVGHLIYACAQVGQFESKRSGDKTWVNQWKPMVDLLIRSTNDWNRTKPADPTEPYFPYLRYFDPYAGHSWFSNSCKGQEAINESIQFAQAAFMWGDLTDNQPMRDMGAMIYTTESEAGKQYWFDYDNATMGSPFAPDYDYGHTGYLREGGYYYQTAASGNSMSPLYNVNSPEQIFGVTLMPFGAGSSLWMGFPMQGVKNEHQDFLNKQPGGFIGDNEGENASHVNQFLSFSDPKASRQYYETSMMPVNPKEGAEFHLMKMLPYQFITTLDSVGRVDTIRGDIPLFSTFRKDTCDTWLRHYMMYNSPFHPEDTVHFTDGTCWWLPKDTLVTYKLMGPDSLKKIVATGGACEGDVIDISVTAKICLPRDPSMYYEYSNNNKATWHRIYNVFTASDSLSIKFTPTSAGTYFFRAVMLGTKVPGLLCPQTDTTDNIAQVMVSSCCPLKIDTTLITKVSCSGFKNGKIVIKASHGTLPYKYSVDSGLTVSSDSTFINLKEGIYHVYVKDANNCAKRLDVEVKEMASIIITAKDSTNNKCFGDKKASASIVVSGGSGIGTYAYLWNDPKQQTTSKADSLYSGVYTVKVTDLNGCNISVKYNLPEAPQLNISSIDITKVDCFGNSTGALKANVSGGTPSYNYLWSNAATTATISNLPAANYTLKVSDQNGCIALSQAEVKSPALLSATINKSGENCFGAGNSGALKAVVTGGVKNYTYQWDLSGSGNVDSLSHLPGGTYNLIVTDANNCVANATSTILQSTAISYSTSSVSPACGKTDGTATVTLTSGSTPVYAYLWDQRAANQTGTTANNLGAGWYSFTITDGAACVKNDSVEVKNLNGVNIISSTFTHPTCFGKCDGTAKVTAQGGNKPYVYVWTLSSSNDSSASNLCAGNYTLTVTDQNLCSASKNFLLKDPQELKLSIAPSIVSPMCVKGSMQITAGVSGGTGSSVPKWNADISISDVNKWNPVITPTAKTIYTLIAKDSLNCKDTATFTLQPVPAVNFTVDTLADCESIQATLSAVTNAIAPYQSTWQIGNNSSTDPVATYTFTPGTYPVKLLVKDVNGCSDSLSQQLSFSIKNHPFADFDFSPQHITMVDPTIYFSNLSTNTSTYKWTFGNGDSAFMTNPVYTYSDSGSYAVCLRATNEYNCYMDTCIRIHVAGITVFYVPNAFTPGGDGRNEVFLPVTSGLDANSYQLQIFNRWGELFFTTNNLSTGWDGTYQGKAVQTDVYVWKIDFKEKDSKRKITKIGHVTVLK
jgi:gliding motility-associated-like protein